MNTQDSCLVYRQDTYYGTHSLRDKSRFIRDLVNRALHSRNKYCIIQDRCGISWTAEVLNQSNHLNCTGVI